jgi:hypothetical protein
MAGRPGEGYADDDRLPWLESVEEEYREGFPVGRMVMWLLVLIAVIGAALFGYSWWHNHHNADGTGELIKAPPGDYKVKPQDAGGMKVQGQGDLSYTASQGELTNGSVDLARTPEEPIVGRVTPTPRPTTAAGSAKVVTAVPGAGERLQVAPAAPKPNAPAPSVRPAAGSAVVQLGAFPDEATANQAWSHLSKRFGYLAPLGKSIERASVNGRTVYRLRVTAGSAKLASDVCGRLKVAGESCFVPK